MKMMVRMKPLPLMPDASSRAKSSPSVFCTSMWIEKKITVLPRALRKRSRQSGLVKSST
jgi:hypothetical protein